MNADNLTVYLTITAMAVVTYFTRSAGLFLASRIRITGRGEAFFKAIPGSIVMAIVAPTVFSGNPADAGASIITVAIAVVTRNLLLSMAAGVGSIYLLRHFMF